MAEKYIKEEKIIEDFAGKLNSEHFEILVESFLDDPVLLYGDNGAVDMATALKSDYFQRLTFGEFVEVEQYLSELCIRIEDDILRDQLITEFELDRDYIESEL